MRRSRGLTIGLRIASSAMVMIGSVAALDLTWGLADITMAMMALCNIIAILLLGGYVRVLLKDYRSQRRRGIDPEYHRDTIPKIASKTECW